MPPNTGVGPMNADYGENDPFSSFDNRIRYADMARHQMVSQYHIQNPQPATMTLAQHRAVATQSRFQYGVQGGQDARAYARRAEMERVSYAAGLARGVADIGTFGLAEAGLAAVGIGGLTGAGLALAIPSIPMHFINKGIQNSVDRQRYMQNIASDVEQHRGKLGFEGGLSFGDANRLSSRLLDKMSAPGQFFNRDQQMAIHKIGLSNDLISAKGIGKGAGSIRQYEKNVGELISTTEDVVKLLQTTIEGGMSVIKELQQKGFGNIRQIRQQVVQAKAFGTMTGMGAQNMMQIGASGAQAVQGTPWASTVGANVYQTGAVMATTMAQSGGVTGASVARVGGAAQAGAILGNLQMSALMSNMSTKLIAYAMKPDGSVDRDRLDRLTSGKATQHEVVTGANQRGYQMGVGGRAIFERRRAQFLNQMSAEDISALNVRQFELWSQNKRGPGITQEDLAWTYAGQMGIRDFRQRDLFTEFLTIPKNYMKMDAHRMMARQMAMNPAAPKSGMERIGTRISETFDPFVEFGESAFDVTSRAIGGVSRGWGATKQYLGEGASLLVDRSLRGLGVSQFGVMDWFGGDVGDRESALRKRYGLDNAVSAREYNVFSNMNNKEKRAIRNLIAPAKFANIGISQGEFGKRVSGMAENEIQWLTQTMETAMFEGTGKTAFGMNRVRNLLKLTDEQMTRVQKDPNAAARSILGMIGTHKTSVNKEADLALTEFDKLLKTAGARKSEELEIMKLSMTNTLKNGGTLQGNDTFYNKITGETESYNADTAEFSIVRKAAQADYQRSKLANVTAGGLQMSGAAAVESAKNISAAGALGVYGYGSEAKKRLSAISKVTGQRYSTKAVDGQIPVDQAMKDLLALDAPSMKQLEILEDAGVISYDNPVDPKTGIMTVLSSDERRQRGWARKKRMMKSAAETGEKIQASADVMDTVKGFLFAAEQTGRLDKLGKHKGAYVDMLSKGGDFTDATTEQMNAFRAYAKSDLQIAGTVTDDQLMGAMFAAEQRRAELQKYNSQTEKIDTRLEKLDRQILSDMGLIKLKDGETRESEKDTDALRKERRDLEEEKDRLTQKMGVTSSREGSQGKSVDTVVAPPVLNYWNNRWVL